MNDDGTRATGGSLTSNTNVQVALDDAAGMIVGAIQRGQKYSTQDLKDIMGAYGQPSNVLYYSCNLLVRLNCDLAYGLLVGRRGYKSTDTAAQAPRYVEALRVLQLLEDGEWVFLSNSGQDAAGVDVSQVQMSQNIGLLSSLTRYFGDLAVSPAQNYPMYSSFDRE